MVKVYINSKPAPIPVASQCEYEVETNGQALSDDFLETQLHINPDDTKDQIYPYQGKANTYVINMTPDEAVKVKKLPNVKSNCSVLYKYTRRNISLQRQQYLDAG